MKKYLKVNHDLLREWGDEVRCEGKSEVHPASRLEGPALIGNGCVIQENVRIKGPVVLGAQCKIGRGAVIEGAVLWQETTVAEKAVLRNCITGVGSTIEAGCYVPEGCVLGDNVTVGEESRLDQGTRVEPDTHLNPEQK